MGSTLVYDGQCPFCRQQLARLQRWAPDPSLRTVSFRDPGALDEFPTLDEQACDQEMKLVLADGRIFGGMEAAVRVLSRRPIWKIALLYYVPGIKQALDAVYRWIARRRLKLSGGVCNDDVCAIPERPA